MEYAYTSADFMRVGLFAVFHFFGELEISLIVPWFQGAGGVY
jgi:hypothetical protein